ncbi:hypothetical protein PENSPDRAFT_648917 [Peniophora sp. CONT]|nr:hypothetical protein PENSPDRAFT_648917 [Peniophora sp. CONT]
MSRQSQKRDYDSSLLQEDAVFGGYSRPLSRRDLQYLRDGVPLPGFIHGRVVGVGFANNIFSIELNTNDGPPLVLRFEGDFASRMHRLAEMGSNIRISTRGAVVESGHSTTLRYTAGAHVAVETVLDAWEGLGPDISEQRPRKRARQSQPPSTAPRVTSASDHTWFSTHRSSADGYTAARETSASPRSTSFPAELPTPRHSSLAAHSDVEQDPTAANDDSWMNSAPLPALSFSHDDRDDSPMDDGMPYPDGQDTPTPAGRNARTEKNREKGLGKKKHREEKKRRKSELSAQPALQPDVQHTPLQSSQEEVEGILQPSANSPEATPAANSLVETFHSEILIGFTTNFSPLKELMNKQKESFIGIVHSAGDVKRATRKDCDWYQTVSLVDPSNLDDFGGILYNDTKPAGLSVMMFSKYEAWLPRPEPGDVLLVCNAKISNLPGDSKLVATGYANEFKWAIFRHSSRLFDAGDRGDAPLSHSVAGYDYTPFLTVSAEEQGYCEKVLDWWDEVQQRRKEKLGTVVTYIGEDSTSGAYSSASGSKRPLRRCHQLVQDVRPDVMPYFDCTIEIVHVDHVGDNTYVYGTDYTRNDTHFGLRPVSTDWCPPNLAHKVLRIEFWGSDSANFVRTEGMDKGQFWTLHNVRLKQANGDRYLEATFSETRKAYRLNEDDFQGNPHLEALMVRRKVFEASNNSPYDSEHSTIAEAEVHGSVTCLLTCTVEVLSVSKSTAKDAPAKMYVTDFAARADLKPPLSLSAGLREMYKDAVLMVEMENQQAARAEDLHKGDIIRIQNLRMKAGPEGKVSARVGGGDNLIRKLDADSDDTHVVELLRRKAAWGTPPSDSSPMQVDEQVYVKVPATFERRRPSSGTSFDRVVIGEILEQQDHPTTFKLKARVVDYEPKDWSNSIIRACLVCGESVSMDDPECEECGAGAEKLEYCFDISFSLVDAPQPIDNTTLDVLARGEWAALADLDPETIAFEGNVEQIMKKRLAKYIWHLQRPDSKNPGNEFEFTIESRLDEFAGVQYHLLSG